MAHGPEKWKFFLYGDFEKKKFIHEYFRIKKVYLCENVHGVMSSRDEHFQKVSYK